MTKLKYVDSNGTLLRRHKYFSSWTQMKRRCYNVRDKAFKHYGGRGIIICDEWLNPNGLIRFLEWIEDQEGWDRERLDIDRVNNDGPYSPENCRLVPRSVNCRFTRRNRFIYMNGEKIHAIDVGKHLQGLNEHQVNVRMSRKWHVFDAVNTPCETRIAKLESIFSNLRQSVKRYPDIIKLTRKEFNQQVIDYSNQLDEFYDQYVT